jgi:TolA-binding protein
VTRLRLQNGRALFDVVHREGRRFEVVAGERVVRVVGTRFTVTRAQDEVVVEVERGLVEVDTPSGVVRLTAGQRWPALEAAAQSPEPPQPTVGLVEPVTEPEVDQPASTAEAKKKRRAAPKASARPPEPVPVEPLPTAPAPPTAAELFSAAIDARRSGKAPEAVAAFERFLTAFPSDPRAPLAHFELGRLKMDSLKDPKGAVTSLERALASPAAVFREEATSRLVRAFDALGRLDDCRRVKADYLSRWPSGSYVQSLNGRCQER